MAPFQNQIQHWLWLVKNSEPKIDDESANHLRYFEPILRFRFQARQRQQHDNLSKKYIFRTTQKQKRNVNKQYFLHYHIRSCNLQHCCRASNSCELYSFVLFGTIYHKLSTWFFSLEKNEDSHVDEDLIFFLWFVYRKMNTGEWCFYSFLLKQSRANNVNNLFTTNSFQNKAFVKNVIWRVTSSASIRISRRRWCMQQPIVFTPIRTIVKRSTEIRVVTHFEQNWPGLWISK